MKTTVQKRLARLAGLFLVSLLVVVTGAQAALAARLEGTGAAGSGSVSQAASSGSSSSMVWIVAVAVAAAVLIAGIVIWTLVRRPRRAGEAVSLGSTGQLAEASSAQQQESWEDSQWDDSQRKAA